MSNEVLNLVANEDKQIALYDFIRTDKQSVDLLVQISIRFNNILKMSDSEFNALCRFRHLCLRANKDTDTADIRNQVFKIANELGLELPSMMF